MALNKSAYGDRKWEITREKEEERIKYYKKNKKKPGKKRKNSVEWLRTVNAIKNSKKAIGKRWSIFTMQTRICDIC